MNTRTKIKAEIKKLKAEIKKLGLVDGNDAIILEKETELQDCIEALDNY